MFQLDLTIFNFINGLAGKWIWLDALTIFFAKYLEYFLIGFLFLFLLKDYKKYKAMVFEAISSVILSRLVIAEIIRQIWHRARPFIDQNVNLLFSYDNVSSFPSGHAAFFFALSTSVYFYNKKAGVLFFIASIFISLARVIAGIHWPSDILAGAVVGLFSGWLVHKVCRKYFSLEN